MTNFCYPYGCVSLLRKLQLQKRFDTCRGIYEGINAGIVDLGLLKVIELYDRTLTRDKLRHVLRRARDRNGWVIFYVHDVAEQPSPTWAAHRRCCAPLSRRFARSTCRAFRSGRRLRRSGIPPEFEVATDLEAPVRSRCHDEGRGN